MGTTTGPPDFVGVGTNKCGTTWWYRLLCMHPGIHHDPGRPKELHHFDRFWAAEFGDEDVQHYHQRFERPLGLLCGEWTPRYSSDPWVPPLLHRSAPAAKWLVLLRDPLDRFVSDLVASERRGLEAPVGRLPDLAMSRSRYAEQLRRLRAAHPVEQILVLQYELCRTQPTEMLHLTQQFLGLPPWTPPDAEVVRPVNAAPGPPRDLPRVLLDGVVDSLAPDLRTLLDDPSIEARFDPALWPTLARVC